MNGVAIAGKAGSGKNEFARHLTIALLGRGLWPVEVSFAAAVKQELWDTRGLKKEDAGGREALLEIGHGRRQADPDYWVRALQDTCGSLMPYGGSPLITDMRYPNELVATRAWGFVTVRIDATRMDRMTALSMRGEDAAFADSEHPSETALDEEDFDVRFWNPHGSFSVLPEYAAHVADLLTGGVTLAA